MTVGDTGLTELMESLDVATEIWPVPVELADAILFSDDTTHHSYDAGAVTAFWRTLVKVERVLDELRARFTGKSSPVHLFWGALDLATTRFSGRSAPPHPGGMPNCGPHVMHEAYSHEVSSAGYWPGGEGEGIFYSYAYPESRNYRALPADPEGAGFEYALGEVRSSLHRSTRRARPRRCVAGASSTHLRGRSQQRGLGPSRSGTPHSQTVTKQATALQPGTGSTDGPTSTCPSRARRRVR
jgi:hypothetical protein